MYKKQVGFSGQKLNECNLTLKTQMPPKAAGGTPGHSAADLKIPLN